MLVASLSQLDQSRQFLGKIAAPESGLCYLKAFVPALTGVRNTLERPGNYRHYAPGFTANKRATSQLDTQKRRVAVAGIKR
jgi:hypothetical protein